jgi:predicted small lipoprotein YifL
MVDRIREMNECQESSLAVRHRPARSAVLAMCALGLALVGALGACGQKGPLYLPTQAGAPATLSTRLPGAQSDGRPVAPLPPLEGASTPGLPTPTK